MEFRESAGSGAGWSGSSRRFFFLICSALCGTAAFLPFVWRMFQPFAINPWEAALAIEGIRFSAGLPLYESGHATHLYGPLLTVALGIIFKIAGLNLVAARVVFSIAALGLTLLLAIVVSPERTKGWIFASSVLFLALNWRASFIFFSIQPDCVAALLAIAALLLWIARDRKWWPLPAALLLFLAAMLFKQTSAAFALIPLVQALIWQRPLTLRKLSDAIVPPAFLVAGLAVIALGWPRLFNGIVVAPATLKVHYDQFFPMLIYLLATFPIFFIALFGLSLSAKLTIRERWICSANVVLIPVGVWTTVKSGGGLNSLLFAYFAMMALVVSQLDRYLIDGKGGDRRKSFRPFILLVALICSLFFQFERSISLFFLQFGDDKYNSAVEIARKLGPGVICPQDPTLVFRANHYIGRCLFLELDRHSVRGEWPSTVPEDMERELAAARYVMEVKNYVPTPMFADSLIANGFRREAVSVLENSDYVLWVKSN